MSPNRCRRVLSACVAVPKGVTALERVASSYQKRTFLRGAVRLTTRRPPPPPVAAVSAAASGFVKRGAGGMAR